METKTHSAAVFSAGFISGVLGVLLVGATLLYMMNMSEVVSISVLKMPRIQSVLHWTYENLRLSVIPFSLTFLLYCGSLWRLKRYLKNPRVTVERISQTEHLVDIWINLFFGIGVIWTAIGMRGALLEGLGDLNAQSAAELGAFSILQRLVDGGILLALSTTIFGAVGGYLLRLVKSLVAGNQIRTYYKRLAEQQVQSVNALLKSIDNRLGRLTAVNEAATQDESAFKPNMAQSPKSALEAEKSI